MSNYYFIVKKTIAENYKLLGVGDKFFYYGLMVLGVVAAFGFFQEAQRYSNNDFVGLLYIGLGAVSYFGSKYLKWSIARERWGLTKEISSDNLLNLESVNLLIDELEKSLASLKSITQWSVGVLTTLIVLVSTLVGNGIFKFIDVAFKVLEKQEAKFLFDQLVTELNSTDLMKLEMLFGVAGNLLLLFALPVVLGYFVFSSVSFIKKQVLGVLYDVRYHYLLDQEIEDE